MAFLWVVPKYLSVFSVSVTTGIRKAYAHFGICQGTEKGNTNTSTHIYRKIKTHLSHRLLHFHLHIHRQMKYVHIYKYIYREKR